MERFEPYDYRALRPGDLNTRPFRHVLLLLYWPLYGAAFALLERGGVLSGFHQVSCVIDHWIPFCEYFFIPYLFWFVYLIGTLAYTFFYDVPAFRRMMGFVILTYTATLAIYVLWPSCQELRPETFSRDNLLTRFAQWFYRFDTNTNVCPSLHVTGSMAALYGLWNSRHFRSRSWRWCFTALTVLICLSTVFVKQHSVLDVAAALPLCAVGWLLTDRWERRHGA